MRKFIFGLLTFFVIGCNSQEVATEEARSWIVNMGGTINGVNCNKYDTDGDGYVSCNVSFKDQNGQYNIVTLECPSRTSWNDVCKLSNGFNKPIRR